LTAPAHDMGVAIAEEGDGSDAQSPRASKSGCARTHNDADEAVPLGRVGGDEQASRARRRQVGPTS
jgi:hypothetical protein